MNYLEYKDRKDIVVYDNFLDYRHYNVLINAFCSDSAYDNEIDCLAHGENWTPGYFGISETKDHWPSSNPDGYYKVNLQLILKIFKVNLQLDEENSEVDLQLILKNFGSILIM